MQRIHGRSGTPLYSAWKAMHRRCRNPRSHEYYRYGGRGIQVCERWNSFENFLADMGERPPGFTLERINNDGNYEPGNCRWATPLEQAQNRRRNTGWKLTPEQADEIRAAYAAGGVSQRSLATRYGVAQAQISRVVNSVHWSARDALSHRQPTPTS